MRSHVNFPGAMIRRIREDLPLPTDMGKVPIKLCYNLDLQSRLERNPLSEYHPTLDFHLTKVIKEKTR